VVQTPNPDGDDVNFLCGTCHNRDYKDPINASGGFVKHHEQWDELMATKHGEGGLTCVTCHDPHTRTIWDGEGIIKNCSECHSEQAATINHSGSATCLDCHMPYAAKSGAKRGMSGFKGDVRSHLFKITPDTASMFTADGSWVRDDETRRASLSPAYSCLGCHNNDPADGISEKTLEAAVAGAVGMHVDATRITNTNELNLGIYPNPSNGPTRISLNLPSANNVNLSIYNAAGQVVYAKKGIGYPRGTNVIFWDGKSNDGSAVNPGYYFIKVSSGGLTSVDKLLLMR
jgi:nitrate/TMAO reductase-like tetraheme cytochrome c subunit